MTNTAPATIAIMNAQRILSRRSYSAPRKAHIDRFATARARGDNCGVGQTVRKGRILQRQLLRLATIAPVVVLAACGSSHKTATTGSHVSGPAAPFDSAGPAASFNRLPASDFPAVISRGQPSETGTLTFRLSLLGRPIALRTSARSVTGGPVGTLTRTGSEFVLRFTRLSYRVAPIMLPDRLSIASQTIALSSGAPNTLLINRHSGSVTSEFDWLVAAQNAFYNGKRTIGFLDRGQRRFLSVKEVGRRRYSVNVLSLWHGSAVLTRWSVDGKALPGGPIAISGTFNGHYLLTLGG